MPKLTERTALAAGSFEIASLPLLQIGPATAELTASCARYQHVQQSPRAMVLNLVMGDWESRRAPRTGGGS